MGVTRSCAKNGGANAQRNFFVFFQAQAVFVLLFAIPFGPVAFNQDANTTTAF